MKIKTFKNEIHFLKIQAKVIVSKSFVSPLATLLEIGTHAEKAGFVLYVLYDKCTYMIALITKFFFAEKKFLC